MYYRIVVQGLYIPITSKIMSVKQPLFDCLTVYLSILNTNSTHWPTVACSSFTFSFTINMTMTIIIVDNKNRLEADVVLLNCVDNIKLHHVIFPVKINLCRARMYCFLRANSVLHLWRSKLPIWPQHILVFSRFWQSGTRTLMLI